MPKIIPPEVESRVLELSKEKTPHKKIIKVLKKQGHDVSLASINRVIHSVGIKRQAKSSGLDPPPNRMPKKVRTPGLIKKVDLCTRKANPPTQTQMSKRFGVSLATVNKIIHKDLSKKTRKKTVCHVLKDSHKVNRKTRCRRLYEEHLAGGKSEFVVSLDEALFYLQDCNGTRRICYTKTREEMEEFVYQKREKFADKFMVVGAISGRGVLPLFKVPPNVKINAKYYQEHVLKPLVEVHIPALYGEDTSKVFLHHDAASSHTARLTTQYANEVKNKWGIKIIENKDIPVKSPDASPMDFFGFGHLKQKLFRSKATTLDGVWKVLQREWNKVPIETVHKVMESWKRRCRLISKKDGGHIEQCHQIHKKKVSKQLSI